MYNEAESIVPMYNELIKFIATATEFIWVDDGSTDNTFLNIRSIAQMDNRVTCISFSRNFGHQAALMAGLKYATGDVLVLLDGDLQHPPAVVPGMLAMLENGFEMVSGKRTATQQVSWFKNVSGMLYYKLLNYLSDTKIEENVADFRVFKKVVQQAILQFYERELFLRGIFNWIGFKTDQCNGIKRWAALR